MRWCSKSGTACACSGPGRAWKRACARNCAHWASAIASWPRRIRTRRRVLANVHDGLAFDEHTLAQRARPACRSNAAGCRSRSRSRCRAWACASCGRCSPCRAMRWRAASRRRCSNTWTRCAASGRAAALLSAAGSFRRPHRVRLRGRIQPGPAVPAAPPDAGPGRVPRRARRRRAALHAACSNTNAMPTQRSRRRPARAEREAGDAVRTGPQPAGTGAAAGAGARHAPGRARIAAVRAGRTRPVRHAPAAGRAVAATARTPARAAGRRRRARPRAVRRTIARNAHGGAWRPASRVPDAARRVPAGCCRTSDAAARPRAARRSPVRSASKAAGGMAATCAATTTWSKPRTGQRAWAFRAAGRAATAPFMLHGWFA